MRIHVPLLLASCAALLMFQNCGAPGGAAGMRGLSISSTSSSSSSSSAAAQTQASSNPFQNSFGGGEGYSGTVTALKVYQNLGECSGVGGRVKNQITWKIGEGTRMTVRDCLTLNPAPAIDMSELLVPALVSGILIYGEQIYDLVTAAPVAQKTTRLICEDALHLVNAAVYTESGSSSLLGVFVKAEDIVEIAPGVRTGFPPPLALARNGLTYAGLAGGKTYGVDYDPAQIASRIQIGTSIYDTGVYCLANSEP
jgi:hypothetical protein